MWFRSTPDASVFLPNKKNPQSPLIPLMPARRSCLYDGTGAGTLSLSLPEGTAAPTTVKYKGTRVSAAIKTITLSRANDKGFPL